MVVTLIQLNWVRETVFFTINNKSTVYANQKQLNKYNAYQEGSVPFTCEAITGSHFMSMRY